MYIKVYSYAIKSFHKTELIEQININFIHWHFEKITKYIPPINSILIKKFSQHFNYVKEVSYSNVKLFMKRVIKG